LLKLSLIISSQKKTKAVMCSTLLLVSVCQNIFNVPAAEALGLLSSSKDNPMLSPSYEKLFQGSGPTTNDNNKTQSEKQLDTSENTDLSPLSLTDSATNKSTTDDAKNNEEASGGAVLKSTVSETNYVPRSEDASVFKAQSIQSDHKGKKSKFKPTISEQAAAVKVGPLSLIQSNGESEQKADAASEAEKVQLADLWEATLTRSPDIQFIVQKLQPTSNHAHVTNILARMLSTAAFGGMGAMSMMSPGMGTYAAASMGGGMIQSVLGMTQSKADKKAKLSQEEEIMMYNMVRTTCDKLVAFYREYKKCSSGLNRAADDYQDLQNMVAEAKGGQDSSKQLDMEYTLRKHRRDMDTIADDLKHHRQNLVDLSGPDAVASLDKQIIEEREKLKQFDGNNIGSAPEETPSSNFTVEPDKTKTASSLRPQS
jgi:hypothetical protein